MKLQDTINSKIWLSDLIVMTFHGYKMHEVDIPTEKAMAPYSSTLAWKIPWMEEPGGLESMGSLRVGHD